MNVEPNNTELSEIESESDVLNGYSADEWIDVMLSADTRFLDMSRGIAIEYMATAEREAKRERSARIKADRVERAARVDLGKTHIALSRKSREYGVMRDVLDSLPTRGVTLTLSGRTVTVNAVTRIKGELGETETAIGSFTLKGKSVRWTSAGKVAVLTPGELVELLTDILPERPSDVMPRKYRDVMRLRHVGRGVTDNTGERAVSNVSRESGDVLSSADMETYGAYLTQVEGPKLTTAGTVSRQGTRGLSAMTDDERRASDRARQAEYRRRKRAERAAMAQATA